MQKNTYFYIPGFPGEASPREENEVRVVDIVQSFAIKKGIKLEKITYPGIEGNEVFSFPLTIAHTFSKIQEKIDLDFEVNLIAQSWGGIIGLLSLTKFPIKKIFLITPFVIRPNNEQIKDILSYYSSEFPALISSSKLNNHYHDVIEIFNSFEKIKTLKSFPPIELLICTDDEIVPRNELLAMIENFYELKNQCHITTIKNDHNFTLGFGELEKWINEYA